MTGSLIVSALYVHPIKSCAANAVDAITLDARGPIQDRRWMIVDEEGRFVTQRTRPVLQTVSVRVDGRGLELSCADRALNVSEPVAEAQPVRVWKDDVLASDAGDEAAQWLSEIVGEPVRLVRQRGERPIDPEFSAGVVSFADGFPLLIANEASIQEIGKRAGHRPDVRRFRPNIVVNGATPFDEDEWVVVEIGGVTFDLVKPCSRCQMVNVDPDTALPGMEPLRSLATYRRQELGVIVGQNAVHRTPGRVCVGQTVRILERTSERTR